MKDEAAFEGLTRIFSDLGYRVQRSQPYAWKIFSEKDSDEIPNEFYTHRYPFCDIFLMKNQRGERFVVADKTVGDLGVEVEVSVIEAEVEEEASEIDVAVLTDHCIQNCPFKSVV